MKGTNFLRERMETAFYNAPHYTARYIAAKALEIEEAELEAHIGRWVSDINDRLGTLNPDETPASDKRVDTMRDAANLLERTRHPRVRHLIEAHYWVNDDSETRKEAGKALGYTPLRVWVHEHQEAVNIAALATGAAALFYYFNR